MDKQLWHRRPDETAKAFSAFILYRDMPAGERSLRKLGQNQGKTPSYIKYLQIWSSRYSWVDRATAYDDYLAQIKAEAQERGIIEMAERQAQGGMDMQGKGIRRIRHTPSGALEVRDAIRLVDVGAKIERTARGEPTEIVKQEHTDRPVKEWSTEELRQAVIKLVEAEKGEES